MKAVIPVAGIGSRLRPHTHVHPKALISVAGKPILAHIVDALVDAGFNDFVYIIGYLGDKIKSYVETTYPNLNNVFVEQHKREGIAHAIWTCKEHIENEDEILIALGDTIFDMDMKAYLSQPISSLGVKEVEDPRRFGVVEVNNEGTIERLVEKPSEPKSNLAIVGIYKITENKKLMESIKYLLDNDIRTKNEYQLTDALMHMITLGVPFHTFNVENWFDCGKKEALIETNAIMLNKLVGSYNTENYINTTIIPPVYISRSAKVTNAILGPNVSVGPNAVVENSILKETIVGPNATVKNIILHDSLIGDEASVKAASHSLNVGDSTSIDYL
jgi:glucose-1-phosphate thymidylyltransferase